MMVMTAKVDFKKVLLGLVAAVALIVALVLLFGNGNEQAAPTGSTALRFSMPVRWCSSKLMGMHNRYVTTTPRRPAALSWLLKWAPAL